MAAGALSCALSLLLCGGVCLGENLVLPSKLEGATQGSALFKPDRLPSDKIVISSWNFKGITIVTAVDPPIFASAYRNRVDLDMKTLAMTLRNLTLNDTGDYTLSINGVVGSYTASTTLQVYEPVSNVTITPNVTELIEFNSTVHLTCSASGTKLSFVWSNGSSEITKGERVVLSYDNRTLTISNVNRHEGGPYTCGASNVISSNTSEPLSLNISYGPDFAYVRAVPSIPIYTSETNVTLTCSAESKPDAQYKWALNGSELSNSGQELILNNIQSRDNGSYTCITHNTKTQRYSISLPIDIIVMEPVSNVTITPNVTELIEFNSTVHLTCSASGTKLSFVWSNGSSEITEGERVVLSDDNRTLTISNVNRHEEGPYTCGASNVISNTTSKPLSLNISYGPDVAYVKAVPSKRIYASESNVTLTCSAESKPDAQYTWALNGSELSNSGQELILNNIQSRDNGNYTCITHNTKTQRYSISLPINITVKEIISGVTITGPSDFIFEGNSSTLTCDANGTVDRVEWMKDNQILSASDISFSNNNRSVTISSVKRDDSGQYQCTFINPVSNKSAVYNMTVKFGPDNIRVLGEREVEEEMKVTLSCSADSEPKASYDWEFNGTKTKVNTGTFLLNSAKFSDSGKYTCIAWNNVTGRYASKYHILKVKEKGTLIVPGGPLSGGAIAGIVIGVILGVSGVAGLIVYFKKRPELGFKADKQNGVTQNGGEHELNYAEVRHVQPDQSVVTMGGQSTQTRHGTPAMVRANRGAAQNQGGKPEASTEVTYAEVKK